MNFTLVICTYKRAEAIIKLLHSVEKQTLYPTEIIIVDGSPDEKTSLVLNSISIRNLKYFLVTPEDRGLTKQRNFGIKQTSITSEIICFLDDDVVLEPTYFQNLLETYKIYPDTLGVGGYIINESESWFVGYDYQAPIDEYYFDGWTRKDGSRFILRKKLGLDSDCPPGYSSLYSHGRSVGFLPPNGKIYPVEMLMGGVSSFRKVVFENFQFSNYFEGYGLYEDADFTLRVAKTGSLYVNTAAQLSHYHDPTGRPNQYLYGKMVVRNGWYVWRVKNPNPSLKVKIKWHSITLLLTMIRFINIFTTDKKQEAFSESLGRIIGWWSLLFDKPRVQIYIFKK